MPYDLAEIVFKTKVVIEMQKSDYFNVRINADASRLGGLTTIFSCAQ